MSMDNENINISTERLKDETLERFKEGKSYISGGSPNYKWTELLIIALFWSVLVSFSIISVTGLILGYKKSDTYLTEMPKGHSIVRKFNDTVFLNKNIVDNVVKNEYVMFNRVLNNNVIVGKNNYLFEIEREENGYNYLLDYIGENPYTEEELKKISDALKVRQQKYLEYGATYMLVVIPSNYTACGEYLPEYVNQSENPTRLMQLSKYMSENSDVLYLELSDKMKGDNGEFLYNNTEDSVNALGAWFIYDSVYNRLDPESKEYSTYLSKNTYTFYKRLTDGGKTADRAGLSEVVKNRTVSLSGDNDFKYSTREFFDDGTVVTYRSHVSDDGNANISVLLEFTSEWDKVSLTPYFSASFDRVAYKIGHEFNRKNVGNSVPDLAIQFIHEYELDLLMSDTINATYKAP